LPWSFLVSALIDMPIRILQKIKIKSTSFATKDVEG